MTFDSDMLTAWVLAFVWPFARIGAMFSVAPLFGARIFPMRIRLMLALMVTWVVQPFVGPLPDADPVSLAGVLVLVQQVLIGLAMGLALQVAFSALIVGGQIIGASMGLGFASMVDPQNGVQVPIVGQLYFILGILLFLALDGHLTMIEVIARSFVSLPVDGPGLVPGVFEGLALWGALMFSEGMRLALPIVSVALLSNVALGVATRAAPQLNIFALGFSITLMLGLTAMLLSVGHLGPLFADLLDRAFAMVRAMVLIA